MLDGVKVVEFGQYLAGPLSGMILGDLGASVVKIERPEGDPLAKLPAYHVWNRGKRVARLDLAAAPAQEEAQELIARADVVIDALKPGALAGFGLGIEQLRQQRPQLIGLSFQGFHPAMAGMPAAWEPIVGALGGVMSPSNMLQVMSEAATAFTPMPIASNFAGLHGAADVIAALFERGSTGSGRAIEVDISGALYTGLCAGSVFVNGRPARIGHFPGDAIDGNPYESVINGQTAMYVCADGSRVMLWASGKESEPFLEVLGFDPTLDAEGRPWSAETLRAALTAKFSERPALEWEAELAAHGFTAIKVRTVEEWLEDRHARESGLVVGAATALGEMQQPGPVVRAEGDPVGPFSGPQPLDSLAAVEWPEPAAAAPPRPPSSPPKPLAGVRVVDLCIVLAGPTVGRVLAELGAEVIKVESPRRPMIERAWLDVNRGKDSLVADLETEEGREILWRLLEDADVLLENFRGGVTERLGLGYEAVAAKHPQLVYGSFNAFGWGGPLQNLPGWEQYAQAISGIQVRNGGRGNPPQITTFTINDYGTGVAGAIGVMAALEERRRSGAGKHVLGALAATAGYHQSMYMLDYDGYQREEIEGQDAVGLSALSRLYTCADGPAYLHATEDSLPQLLRCEGLEGIDAGGSGRGAESPLAAALEERFRQADIATWSERLAAAGVAFARVRTIPEFITDERARAVGHLATSIVPGYGRVDTVGSCGRFDGEGLQTRAAHLPGSDNVEVLRAAGYDDDEIASLFVTGIVQSSAEASAPQQTETASV